MKSLALTNAHWKSMELHVETCLPMEGCGLLAGTRGRVGQVIPVTNQAHSPGRFRMEPAEQLQALYWIEANEMQLLGIFHSHPDGPAGLSPTDIGEAAYPVVHVIWSRLPRGWGARGFWIGESGISDVKLDVSENE